MSIFLRIVLLERLNIESPNTKQCFFNIPSSSSTQSSLLCEANDLSDIELDVDITPHTRGNEKQVCSSPLPKKSRKSPVAENSSVVDTILLKVASKISNQQDKKSEERSPDELWCMSLAADLGKLTGIEKIKISQVVPDALQQEK